ncbi:putative membrane protein [Chitinivorax tropicus]|uniref:Putative membrane protein n=1 Tax=Chitinivorax tropicus TaxID=714531 RepID=A0A840MKB0_9PROT|nr:DUF1003 domain-containing protein [Chitinivorax tropicus]MBB5018840.1 putative membrane protein [Chitinivorax tropicus]
MKPENKHLRYLAEHLLNTGVGGLGARERAALLRISKRLQTHRGDSSLHDEGGMTFGERLADRVAEFGGSWTFITMFGAFLLGWAILNTDILRDHAFDPYPYVFLNLVLSMLAAIQAPIIMMSQNRQAARDRLTMIRDFEVNLKAELAISELHLRVDHLTWQILGDLDLIKRHLLTQDVSTPPAPPTQADHGKL